MLSYYKSSHLSPGDVVIGLIDSPEARQGGYRVATHEKFTWAVCVSVAAYRKPATALS